VDASSVVDGYIVIDTHRGTIWNAGSKRVWVLPAHAKNAWCANRREGRFNAQKRFVVRPVRFVDVETGNYFT
jgi:hypothetical protein